MIELDSDVEFYIAASFQKIRLLKKSDKGEVWLASTSAGEPVILKRAKLTGLPYLKLKENPHQLWAKILFFTEGETESIVVEEFINGETLEGKTLTELQARQILNQLCEGLKILHGLGIIHRDIKPSNLILQAGGIVRLIDFDAARIFKENQPEDTIFLGTKGYAPPEQFGFGQTDSRSDIYSLGVTIQKLLGGNCSSLEKILAKCTELDPRRRYSSIEDLQLDLNSPPKKFNFKILAASVISGVLIFSAFNFSNSQTKIETPPLPQIEEVPVTPKPEKKIPPAVVETSSKKFSPFNAEDLKIPPLDTDYSKTPEVKIEIPKVTVELAQTNSGKVETNLYLNGKIFDQFRDENVKISAEDLAKCQIILQLRNNTREILQDSAVEIHFRANKGGTDYQETKKLSPLKSGDLVNLEIPLHSYELAKGAKTAWLQIYLRGNEKFFTEKYWCVVFDIT